MGVSLRCAPAIGASHTLPMQCSTKRGQQHAQHGSNADAQMPRTHRLPVREEQDDLLAVCTQVLGVVKQVEALGQRRHVGGAAAVMHRVHERLHGRQVAGGRLGKLGGHAAARTAGSRVEVDDCDAVARVHRGQHNLCGRLGLAHPTLAGHRAAAVDYHDYVLGLGYGGCHVPRAEAGLCVSW